MAVRVEEKSGLYQSWLMRLEVVMGQQSWKNGQTIRVSERLYLASYMQNCFASEEDSREAENLKKSAQRFCSDLSEYTLHIMGPVP